MITVLVIVLVCFAWSAGYWHGRARAQAPPPTQIISGPTTIVREVRRGPEIIVADSGTYQVDYMPVAKLIAPISHYPRRNFDGSWCDGSCGPNCTHTQWIEEQT